MDETGVPFDMPADTTVDFKGVKNVPIKSTNNSSSCTVFLACAIDGSKKILNGQFIKVFYLSLELELAMHRLEQQ